MAEEKVIMEEKDVQNVTVEAKEGFGTKFKNGFKKHGKKIAVIAVTLAAGAAGYVLGKKLGCNNDDYDYDMNECPYEILPIEEETTE